MNNLQLSPCLAPVQDCNTKGLSLFIIDRPFPKCVGRKFKQLLNPYQNVILLKNLELVVDHYVEGVYKAYILNAGSFWINPLRSSFTLGYILPFSGSCQANIDNNKLFDPAPRGQISRPVRLFFEMEFADNSLIWDHPWPSCNFIVIRLLSGCFSPNNNPNTLR